MASDKITIHRALAEIKLIDQKVEKRVSVLVPSAQVQKGRKVNNQYTEEEFNQKTRSDYQSITDLIKRKIDLKSAIVLSNSSTTVEVAGKTMTVSDAISYKSILQTELTVYKDIEQKHTAMKATINKNNDTVDRNADILAKESVNGDTSEDSAKQAETIRATYVENQSWKLVDPLKVDELCAAKFDEINEFLMNVDHVLSESNATTFIEV